jgi:hypothetical protein
MWSRRISIHLKNHWIVIQLRPLKKCGKNLQNVGFVQSLEQLQRAQTPSVNQQVIFKRDVSLRNLAKMQECYSHHSEGLVEPKVLAKFLDTLEHVDSDNIKLKIGLWQLPVPTFSKCDLNS